MNYQEAKAEAQRQHGEYDSVGVEGTDPRQECLIAGAEWERSRHSPRVVVAAPSDTDKDVRAWIDKTLALPMYQNAISEYGQGVVETLRTVRKLLDGGMHPDARAALHASQPVQVEVTDDEPCSAELWSWDYFNDQQVDPYWMRCHLVGEHDEHENSETGATWRTPAALGGGE